MQGHGVGLIDAKGQCGYRRRRRWSKTFTECAEHLCAIGIDLFGGWGWTVLGKGAAARFERGMRGFRFERGCQVAFENDTKIAGRGNAVGVGLLLQGRFKLFWKFNEDGRVPYPAVPSIVAI